MRQPKISKRIVIASMAGCALTPAIGQKPSKPNIIYIMCDDMGYGDLGCYGQPFIETPHIDQLATEGMRFTQAYAGAPVSAPSRACMMTGQHTGHTRVRGNEEFWKDVPMVKYGENEDYSRVGQLPYDAHHVIVPEILKSQGYRTGMFSINKLLFPTLVVPFDAVPLEMVTFSRMLFLSPISQIVSSPTNFKSCGFVLMLAPGKNSLSSPIRAP